MGDVSAYGFLAPSMLVFAVFTVWPVFRAFLLAFQDYAPGAGVFQGFTGWKNFADVLASPDFLRAVRNTAIYTAVVVPAQIALGLVLASLLYPLGTAARNFFRAAFYLPGVASVVVMAMVWRWLYDDSFGLLNNLLSLPALGPIYQTIANLTPLIARPGSALAALYGVVFACLAARDLLGRPRLAAFVAAAAGLVGAAWLARGLAWTWHPHQPVSWLTSTELSLFSIALSTVLKGPGGALLIYLAAMEAIPPELFEAARSDGAGPLAQWWHVMLPLVRPTTLFLAITGAIDSFQVFAQVLMLTDGGPAGSSTVLVHQMYTRAFRDLEFGQASAMALMLFCVLVAVSLAQYRFLRTDWEF
ncbi:MAG: sugar ABC transporter permease [Candidatus Wallbacteria bacterium]|nr:sugar ABC transporter permease [Candidatus Wallbacteria bacterium]